MVKGLLAAALGLGIVIATDAVAGALSGTARVIDGDTLEVAGTIVRLADIDAPELGQTCEGPKAIRACGRLAADFLAGRIEGGAIACDVSEIDTYGRSIATCRHNGDDLSAWMVR